MTYPISFRRHVLAVKDREKLTFAATAARFSIGIASLVRWSKLIEPKSYVRRRGLKIDLDALARDVRDHPDACQHERAARFFPSGPPSFVGARLAVGQGVGAPRIWKRSLRSDGQENPGSMT